MKHTATLILIMLMCYAAHAQSGGKVEYTAKCGLTGFPVDEADQLAHFDGNLSKYFDKRINWKQMELIGGLIIVDVAVDTSGHACAVGYTNKTVNSDYSVTSLYLENIINRMPNWKPAMKNGKPVNNTTRLAIYSAVEGHKDLEVDYFRTFAQQTEKIRVIPRPVMVVHPDASDLNKVRAREAYK